MNRPTPEEMASAPTRIVDARERVLLLAANPEQAVTAFDALRAATHNVGGMHAIDLALVASLVAAESFTFMHSERCGCPNCGQQANVLCEVVYDLAATDPDKVACIYGRLDAVARSLASLCLTIAQGVLEAREGGQQ